MSEVLCKGIHKSIYYIDVYIVNNISSKKTFRKEFQNRSEFAIHESDTRIVIKYL